MAGNEFHKIHSFQAGVLAKRAAVDKACQGLPCSAGPDTIVITSLQLHHELLQLAVETERHAVGIILRDRGTRVLADVERLVQ